MRRFSRPIRLLAAAVLVAGGAGCRVPRQVELLQREVRRRDERIFELEYKLQQYQGSYLSPGSNAITEYPLGLDAAFGGSTYSSRPYEWSPELSDETDSVSPRRAPRTNPTPAETKPPRQASPPTRDAAPRSAPSENPAPFEDPEIDLGDNPEELFRNSNVPRHRSLPGRIDPRAPDQIVVNELLTAGYERGGPGVQVVCELRDASGRPMQQVGAIEVRVSDADRIGPPLASVSYDRHDALGAWRETPLGPALFLDAAIERAGSPRSVVVDVAYQTPDGRILTDRHTVDLEAGARRDRTPFTRQGGEELTPIESPHWAPRRD